VRRILIYAGLKTSRQKHIAIEMKRKRANKNELQPTKEIDDAGNSINKREKKLHIPSGN